MKKFVGFFLILCYTGVFAQNLDKYEKKEYTCSGSFKLTHRILYPKDYDKDKKHPLILFLHKGVEYINENQLINDAALFLKEDNQVKVPCIVIAPQCPPNNFWASVTLDRNTSPIILGSDYNNQPNNPMISFVEIVKQVCLEENVEKSLNVFQEPNLLAWTTFANKRNKVQL